MAALTTQKSPWPLVRRQHGVITRAQLLELGFTPAAIKHRVATARLHPLWRGGYAAGSPHGSREGGWRAAVLTCGPAATLSHWDAAVHWKIRKDWRGPIHVSVPAPADPRPEGVVVHRRAAFE